MYVRQTFKDAMHAFDHGVANTYVTVRICTYGKDAMHAFDHGVAMRSKRSLTAWNLFLRFRLQCKYSVQ